MDIQELYSLIDLDLARSSEKLSEIEKKSVAQVLRVWAHMHPEPGYRQGMHELAARLWKLRSSESCLIALATDTQEPNLSTQSIFHVLLMPEEVESDTYFLFSALANRLIPLYYQSERAGSPALIKAILHRADSDLGAHLQAIQLDWVPILLRWHRLLYMYEFPENTCVELWDTLFAIDSTLQLVPYISTVLLLSHRDEIMNGDYIEVMQLLMHMPDIEIPRKLVEQALQLYKNPSASTGAAIASSYGQHPPPPEPSSSRIDLARTMLRDLALGLVSQGANPQPTWSPRSEDRLNAETPNHAEQRKRAMLSLDNVHDHY